MKSVQLLTICILMVLSVVTLAADMSDNTEGLSQRDPFRLPQYLILKIKEKTLGSTTATVGVDDSVESVRRWPLSTYQLVAIMWDVKKPKAMFLDKQNSMHMLQQNERIGNGGGVISVINNGEVVVIENKTALKLKLKK